MLLKELMPGSKFMFSDRNTPLAHAEKRGSYAATGTFIYQGVGVNTCPKLVHVESKTELLVVSGTYWRNVLIIFS